MPQFISIHALSSFHPPRSIQRAAKTPYPTQDASHEAYERPAESWAPSSLVRKSRASVIHQSPSVTIPGLPTGPTGLNARGFDGLG